MQSIKTVKLPLVALNADAQGELDNLFHNFRWVYDETAKRLPSLPRKRVGRPKDPVYYEWVKEFRRSVDLPAQVAQEAVQKARESYASMLSNKVYSGVPRSGQNVARFHNQCFNFERFGDWYFLDLPLRGGRGHRALFPVDKNDYAYSFLDSIESKELSYGSGELKRYGGSYSFNLTVKKDVEVHGSSTPVGVDFGIKNIAVACAYEKQNPHVKIWSGKRSRYERAGYLSRIGKLQKMMLLRDVRRTKNKYRRYMSGVNHRVSREIIDFASGFFQPYIVLEKLHKFRKKNDWTFSELRIFIEYKALERGIPVITVDPRNTSNKCNKCGYTDSENRKGITFKCLSCGYEVNADVNAAINIAVRTPSPLL